MPDVLKYDFFECDSCGIGYAVEVDQIEEPCCPACQDPHYRFVVTRAFEPKHFLEDIGNCVRCEQKATLALEDGKYICETCAQVMGEMADA